MNNPTAPNAANPSTDNWLGEVPGGDIPLDQLFSEQPADSTSNAPTTAQPSTPVQAQPATSEPVFKTSRSVYMTMDDAKKGVEEKDTLIEQLRARLTQVEGVDPITRRPAAQPAQQPASYLQDPTRFMRDASEAVSKADPNAYFQVHAKLLGDYLEPVAPILQEFARSRAVESVTQEYKDFRDFRTSPAFDTVLESNPVLKHGILGAESDPRFYSQLPGLYKLAYAAHIQTRMPEMLKASAAQAAQSAPAQPTRPTTAPATMNPATSHTAGDLQEQLRTSEGRQAIIARFKHLENVQF